MKRLLLFLLLLAPFVNEISVAQKKVKLRIDKVDKFEKKRVFATDWIRIHSSMKTPSAIYLSIVKFGDTPALAVKIMSGVVDLVPTGAEAKFMLSNGDIKVLTNVGETLSARGDGAVGLSGSNAQGLHLTYKGDISFLADGNITDVRFEGQEYMYDAELKEKAQKLIKAMYDTYLDAMNE